MVDLLDLPSELRALATFLEQGVDAAAIIRTSDNGNGYLGGGKAYGTAYRNEQFQRQPLSAREIMQELIEQSTQRQAQLYRNEGWQLRQVLPDWGVLIASAHSGHGHASQHAKDDYSRLDWTRYEVSGDSPWIDFIRGFDWAATGLGAMPTWPFALRQHVFGIMQNSEPRSLIWGEQRVLIYNQACLSLFGNKHPRAMGMPWKEACDEIQEDVLPMIDAACSGKPTKLERVHLNINRGEMQFEETFWDIAMLPVMDECGRGAGMLCELSERTRLVRDERRRDAILKLGESFTSVTTLKELWTSYLAGLKQASNDVPFAFLYSVVDDLAPDVFPTTDPDSYCAIRKKAVLEGSIAMPSSVADLPESFTFRATEDKDAEGDACTVVKSCLTAMRTRASIALNVDDGTLPASLLTAIRLPIDVREVRTATITPIFSVLGHEILGFHLAGHNPRCPWDDGYRRFMSLVPGLLAKTASLISMPTEQRRAQKISDDINESLAQQLRWTTLQVEKSDERFSRMASLAPTGMFRFNKDGHPVYVNQAYLDLLGDTAERHSARDATREAWEDRIHPDDLDRVIQTWHSLMEDKIPITVEYRLKKGWQSVDPASGDEIVGERWLLANAFPELEPDGSVSAIQGWLADVSHRKFAESLLTRRLQDALETKLQMERFIDTTCHEIRNPLSAVLQSADAISSTMQYEGPPLLAEDMVLSHKTVDEILDNTDSIVLCAQHMRRIVDDILTLSKLDASLLSITPDKCHMQTLIGKALKMFEAEITHAGIHASLGVEPSYVEMDIDCVILDSSRVLQVFINLLTNAIKFTQYSDERNITVCLGASSHPPTGHHHGLSFVPTRSGRPSQTSRVEWGEGEDIYIQVAVTDTGKGLSAEEMQLLFQRFQQASTKTYQQYGGSGLGLWISRELVELQGGQIGVMSSGGRTKFAFYVHAKRWIGPAQSEARSGWPLQHYASTTSNSNGCDRKGSILLKPQALPGWGRQMSADAVSGARNDIKPEPTPGGSLHKQAALNGVRHTNEDLHVLVVEDNLINARIMSQQLRKAGCTVHVASHGQHALDFLDKTTYCSASIPLSVVLLDLEMPVMDGLTCVKHIRERQATGHIKRHVPVVAVTANARSEQIAAAIEAGMDSVVTKPVRNAEILEQIHRLLADIEHRRDELG